MKQRIVKWFQQPCITFTWMSAFLYGLFFILMLITISNKENYHIDEIATFRLANGPYYQFFQQKRLMFLLIARI